LRAALKVAGLLALGSMLLTVGCHGPQLRALGADEQRVNGAVVFHAPRERVFAACAAALRTMGYRIASELPEAGVIVTERKQARSVTSWDGERTYQRSYRLEAKQTPDSGVELWATPVLFEVRGVSGSVSEPREVPAETAWTPAEESAEWKRLFENVRRELDAPDSGFRRPLLNVGP